MGGFHSVEFLFYQPQLYKSIHNRGIYFTWILDGIVSYIAIQTPRRLTRITNTGGKIPPEIVVTNGTPDLVIINKKIARGTTGLKGCNFHSNQKYILQRL
jgi:hypothetical protein